MHVLTVGLINSLSMGKKIEVFVVCMNSKGDKQCKPKYSSHCQLDLSLFARTLDPQYIAAYIHCG